MKNFWLSFSALAMSTMLVLSIEAKKTNQLKLARLNEMVIESIMIIGDLADTELRSPNFNALYNAICNGQAIADFKTTKQAITDTIDLTEQSQCQLDSDTYNYIIQNLKTYKERLESG
ncbi:MAG TPA: hypothetical protein VHA52_00400, partial [Candidatus Babeliaceae bacterium]|nr:hypothetical protein [Candidatus Babeliaceae bacterium]